MRTVCFFPAPIFGMYPCPVHSEICLLPTPPTAFYNRGEGPVPRAFLKLISLSPSATYRFRALATACDVRDSGMACTVNGAAVLAPVNCSMPRATNGRGNLFPPIEVGVCARPSIRSLPPLRTRVQTPSPGRRSRIDDRGPKCGRLGAPAPLPSPATTRCGGGEARDPPMSQVFPSSLFAPLIPPPLSELYFYLAHIHVQCVHIDK